MSGLAIHFYAQLESPGFALGFVALVPWLALLDRTSTLRGAAALGVAFCVVFVLAVFSWFAVGMARYADAPVAAGFAALVLAAPVLQPQLPVHAVVRHLLRSRLGPRRSAFAACAAALAYVATEWALPKLFGDTLGHGLLAASRLCQAAEIAGAGGLTLALVLCNEAVLAAARAAARPAPLAARVRATLVPAAGALGLVLALALYGELRLRALAPALAEAPRVRVALVQADVARYGRLRQELGTGGAVMKILDAQLELTGEAFAHGRPDLVLWPETVYPTTFGSPKSDQGAETDRVIGRLVSGSGVPLVFGAYDTDGRREFNAAFFLERDGEGRVGFDTYRKASLFPLTEHVPAWMAPLRRLLPWLGTWQPGDGAKVMAVDSGNGRRLLLAPLICYDAVVPHLALDAARHGAQLIVTLSNDSWFPGGARLHLAVSAFRSLETRRAQARVTNTGISALILPTGEIRERAEIGERTVVVGELPLLSGGTTPILVLGDWLGPAACVVALLVLATARTEPRSRRRRT